MGQGELDRWERFSQQENEGTAVHTFGSVMSEALLGPGTAFTFIQEPQYHADSMNNDPLASQSENCFETSICFCNRRIDLLSTQKRHVQLGEEEAVHWALAPSAIKIGRVTPKEAL